MMIVAETDDRRGRYDAHVDGHRLVTSTQPFLDGARALIEQGYDPARLLVMQRPGREQVDLRAPLAVAAGLDVRSTPGGKPVFRRLRDGSGTVVLAPPIAPNGEPYLQPIQATDRAAEDAES
jgi:hypothetical protein